ncbi:ATP-binding protein [Ilyobacter polytropus]|uniref:histidine kinase n=1 Tax=Ilyobacter polytropus (strain ATCC 51220 / DSM 2926 / LMG 16218 / CuHBu1) TaxID=572544 RepID=E3HD14_ILYPC|nr:ATP-binding protein [Ilyobacter polytropus]ADO84070.1 PAS/PAC sensor signal transduction histidine kinase [Ilyobacter polytropus DSM 2926]
MQREYFQEIFNNVLSAMILINNKGEITYINREFSRLFGYSPDESIGKPLSDLISPQGNEKEITENIERVKKGEQVLKEVVRQGKNGELIELVVIGSPIIIKDKHVASSIVFSDMTERKENQIKLEKANKELKEATSKLIHTERISALGELTSSIAHELNQPLNNMKIVCQDILRDVAKDRLEVETIPESIEDMEEQINKMARIIDHMRIFTRRLDSNMNMEKININDPIKNMFLLIGEQLKTKNIDTVKNLNEELPRVWGSSIGLEQIFTNILINARHALEEKECKNKKIEIESFINGENEVSVSIKNNGGLIPLDIKERIFEPFFTTKEPGKGTGLGLSISKKIIEEHSGRIEIEDEGQWTKFIITLPALTGNEVK